MRPVTAPASQCGRLYQLMYMKCFKTSHLQAELCRCLLSLPLRPHPLTLEAVVTSRVNVFITILPTD